MFRIEQSVIQAPPFASLEAAQTAHLALVDEADNAAATMPGDPAEGRKVILTQLRAITAFEWRLAATGARIASVEQRILAQSLLDYWALRRTDLRTREAELRAVACDRPPLAARGPAPKTLLPYNEASAPELADDLAPFARVLPVTHAGGEGTPEAPSPTSGDDVRSRIAAAASEAGLQLSGDAITQVLRQVAVYPEPLALARWAFDWLWRKRDRNRITDATLVELGDPARKLGATAEETYAALASDADRAIARQLFLALVGQAGEVWVRRAADMTQLASLGDPAPVKEVADAFAATGVLTRLPASEGHPERLVPAHEALLLHWQRLREWLTERAGEERGIALVHAAALGWSLSHNDDDLPQGEALDRAAQFAERDPLIAEYVAAGRDYADRQQHQTSRRRTIFWSAMGAGAIVALPSVYLAGDYSADTATVRVIRDIKAQTDAVTAALVQSERKQAVPVSDMIDPVDTDLAAAPGFTAWLWVGSDDAPQLATDEGAPLPPSKVGRGDRALLRFDMNLRPRLPSTDVMAADYGTAGAKPRQAEAGTGTAGLYVLALEPPKMTKVNDADQYWLRAKIVPRVYFQTSRDFIRPAQALRKDLAMSGFDMPGIEERDDVSTIRKMREVRYYFDQDKGPAEQLAAAVQQRLRPSSEVETIAVRRITDPTLVSRARAGIIELWLGETAARATARVN